MGEGLLGVQVHSWLNSESQTFPKDKNKTKPKQKKVSHLVSSGRRVCSKERNKCKWNKALLFFPWFGRLVWNPASYKSC